MDTLKICILFGLFLACIVGVIIVVDTPNPVDKAYCEEHNGIFVENSHQSPQWLCYTPTGVIRVPSQGAK